MIWSEFLVLAASLVIGFWSFGLIHKFCHVVASSLDDFKNRQASKQR
jgi:hypothetical protein